MRRKLIFVSASMLSLLMVGCVASTESEWTESYQSLDASTLEDQAKEIVACLDEAGFPGYTTTFDGGVISPAYPEDQQDAYDAAFRACHEEVTADLPDVSRPTQGQLEALYGHEVAAWNCLTDLGYETSAPPSFQVYQGDWGTADQWSAWGAAADIIGSSYRSVQEDCPDPGWFVASIFAEAD
jgi:hypothetical protein